MDTLRPPETTQDVEPVYITVRFSASLPDLRLTIDNPTISTAATLKQHIRKQLPPDLSDRRIRLIYAGRALLDTLALSAQLRLSPSRRPSRSSTPIPQDDPSSKGKQPLLNDPPIYIHCSIGDITLSPTELTLETTQSLLLTSPVLSQHVSSSSSSTSLPGAAGPSTTTTPAPRGFDRLLTAGFTPEEVRTLRSQFMAIQSHSHTPDTMPSAAALRDLEDRWLDNGEGGGLSGTAIGAGAGGDEDASGALDDLLWGAVMGFFWPVGCLWWAGREEGIWSRRKKWGVVLGVLINAGIGGLRWLS